MEDIGARIREYRAGLGWSLVKLATLAEMDPSFLSRLERGLTGYSSDSLTKIAGALGMSVQELFPNGNVKDAPVGWREIPVLDLHRAGSWTRESRPTEEELARTVVADLGYPPSTLAVELIDNSMEAPPSSGSLWSFQRGDTVVIDPTQAPSPGAFVVASDGSGVAYFRQYRLAGRNEKGDEVFELHALNPTYGAMRSDRQPLSVVGVMVERRQYWKP